MSKKYISFLKIVGARTGNILFQYLAAKLISLKFGHTYIWVDHPSLFPNPETKIIMITDDNIIPLLSSENSNISDYNIICRGFFQLSKMFIDNREILLDAIRNSDDWWIGVNGEKEGIRKFFECQHNSGFFTEKDKIGRAHV